MIDIRKGQVDKPGATEVLSAAVKSLDAALDGVVYVGYPVMGTPDGPFTIDALLVSPQIGLIAFDLVEGRDLSNIEERQDGIFSVLTAKLLQGNRRLSKKKRLAISPKIVTLAPNVHVEKMPPEDYDAVRTSAELKKWILRSVEPLDAYKEVLATVQSISNIRRSRARREIKRGNSRGAHLQRLEDTIAVLDGQQSDAVIQTYNGVQRIRGLAGSGKTIVLALKVAYLYTQNPDWLIAVTFNTRSLKGQFQRLITSFIYDQANEEVDWSRVKILHAWGSAGENNEGIYYTYCINTGISYHDLAAARKKFEYGKEFAGICEIALSQTSKEVPMFDVVLVDEAQDFSPSFLRLCYRLAKTPKRIVYAYDELQNLSHGEVPPPEVLFGEDKYGQALVRFSDDPDDAKRQDIILRKCYRNSRPVLTTAHALGFGIYRDNGLAQIFDNPELWTDIGYELVSGELKGGRSVTLTRTDETSPRFLEADWPVEDLISFHQFANESEQADWIAQQITMNVKEDELRPEDILVIHSDPLTTRKKVGGIRGILLTEGISSILAGVTHAPDVFEYSDSVTFTGIYRAKGNEAGMVYVMNAQYCASDWDAAWVRNVLFTAITRSKAWVRVCGYGRGMATLRKEFEAVKVHEFKLRFRYPDEDQREKMKIVNRDVSMAERTRRAKTRSQLRQISKDLKTGRLRREDIEELLDQLAKRD